MATTVLVTPDYPSIECIRNLVEPWIDLLGSNEWEENMRGLHQACHTDYGFSDEDCALFATKLFENLEHMKTSGWIDEDGPSYGIFTHEDVAATQERCRGVRDYWLNDGNFGATVEVTLVTVPGWVFGEEEDETSRA